MNETINKLKNIDKTEYGWCKSKLFGESNLTLDKEGIENKKLDIFYMIRKSNIPNAPFMVFFNGGPGVGFTNTFLNHLENKNFFPNLNVVCIDQRGTGFSSKASTLEELKYYSARYISYDVEQIRKKVLGKNGKWIVFGESYGGHIVRKYMELYPSYVLTAISHGYGECSPITMKVNIKIQTHKLINSYFKKYPKDLVKIKKLKSKLNKSHSISTDKKKVSGTYLLDALAYIFGPYSEEQIHNLINNLDNDNLVNDYIKSSEDFIKILLNASDSKLNSVVSYIDLLEGLSDDKLNKMVKKKQKKMNYNFDESLISKDRFNKGIKNVKDNDNNLDKLINNDYFKADLIDFKKLIKNLEKNKVTLYIFASKDDSMTPIEAIKEEKKTIEKLNGSKFYNFHFVNGGHGEWLHNNDKLFSDIIKSYLN
ncbi:MAG: alpha/beta hydrolase [Firmicutes bacterium]|nr:alpha/beta hydrolase [Bacillota bacterium]